MVGTEKPGFSLTNIRSVRNMLFAAKLASLGDDFQVRSDCASVMGN
jgi:hypothetical protein